MTRTGSPRSAAAPVAPDVDGGADRQTNHTDRTEEALATGASAIAVACPFCRIMLSDGLTSAQANDEGEGVEVLDVAQLLLAGVNRGHPDAVATE